jgi:hypothetical protein
MTPQNTALLTVTDRLASIPNLDHHLRRDVNISDDLNSVTFDIFVPSTQLTTVSNALHAVDVSTRKATGLMDVSRRWSFSSGLPLVPASIAGLDILSIVVGSIHAHARPHGLTRQICAGGGALLLAILTATLGAVPNDYIAPRLPGVSKQTAPADVYPGEIPLTVTETSADGTTIIEFGIRKGPGVRPSTVTEGAGTAKTTIRLHNGEVIVVTYPLR